MKSLLLLSAFLCSALSAAAQAYQPFPTTNAHWRCRLIGLYALPYKDVLSEQLFYLNGSDTNIKGIQYKQVFLRQAFDTFNMQYADYTHQPIYPTIKNTSATQKDEYFGAIRESNKQIFTFTKSDTTEKLQLDYNLALGDSMLINGEKFCIVTNIDSVLVGSVYHRRYISNRNIGSSTLTYEIIEGIGPTKNSLFHTVNNGQTATFFHCFNNNYNTYTSSIYPCTYIFPYGTPTATNNTVANKPANIHPNPFSHQLTIDADAAFVKLTDAMGKVVMNEAIQAKTFNTTNLPVGFYILTLQDKDGNTTERRKLIKE